APPKGIFTTAHFQVIHVARARTSSIETSGAKRIPPLPGPRTVECSTRYPVNTSRVPLSIPIGMYRRSEEHTSELQSRGHLVCRLLLEKKKKTEHGSRGR